MRWSTLAAMRRCSARGVNQHDIPPQKPIILLIMQVITAAVWNYPRNTITTLSKKNGWIHGRIPC
ncbi:MAG: hypothetical protein Q7U60_07080, partial [Candidatus Methanoperedens sp.]|nr:hypothetical protein [Candidatus Methanoperedens sp.]